MSHRIVFSVFFITLECISGDSLLAQRQQATPWQINLKIYRELAEQQSPDSQKLALALVNLAVIAVEKESPSEAIRIFEEAFQRRIMPAEVKPYYGSLLFQKSFQEADVSQKKGATEPASESYHSHAYQLFSESYEDELGKASPDENRLLTISEYILSLCSGEKEKEWLKRLVNTPYFSVKVQAEFSYRLGVLYWKEAYDISYPYSSKKQNIPEVVAFQIGQFVDESLHHLDQVIALDEYYANAWFYKKLVLIEMAKVEADESRKAEVINQQEQAQKRYMEIQETLHKLSKNSTGQSSKEETSARSNASGLPAIPLMYRKSTPAPSPPPPPSPPSKSDS